jgi:pimeloyl-ACP methyl ester carboxylesterase
MDMIPVNGARLSSFRLGGSKETPVILLHGLVSGNMASWYFRIALPLSVSRQVLLYDQRGHGESSLPHADAPARFDLDSQVADLEAVLAYHGCAETPVDIAGHSMGALIALHFALRQPHRVRRLALVDAPMPACDYAGPSLLGVTSHSAFTTGCVVPASGTGRRQERMRRRLSALFMESTLIRDVLAMGAEADAELAALQRPVLLVYGRQSPCLAAGHHLQRVLPRARLELLDCGHYVLEEAPVELRGHLEAFFSAPDSKTEQSR